MEPRVAHLRRTSFVRKEEGVLGSRRHAHFDKPATSHEPMGWLVGFVHGATRRIRTTVVLRVIYTRDSIVLVARPRLQNLGMKRDQWFDTVYHHLIKSDGIGYRLKPRRSP